MLSKSLPTVIIPAEATFFQAQIAITMVFMSPVWNTALGIEIASWLWAAFLIALGIRQVNELSTSAALVSSYVIMLIFLAIYASALI